MYLVKTEEDYGDWDYAYQGMFGRVTFKFSIGWQPKLMPGYADNIFGHKIEFRPEFEGEIMCTPDGKILVWCNGRLIYIK